MQNEKSIRKDVNILDLFNGLSRKQAKSLQECALAILPPLREVIIKSYPQEEKN
jgi:hypothetical protein